MMRRFTASAVAVLAIAGLSGAGAALAGSSHHAKPTAAAVSNDKSSSEDLSSGARGVSGKSSKEHSTADTSRDKSSSDHSVAERDSGR